MMAIVAWLLNTSLGRAVGGIALCALLFLGGKAWLSWHDAGIRDAARAGYVLQSQAEAAEAKLTEVQRQVDAGQIVIASYQEIIKNARAKDAVDDAQLANDRKDFEAKLAAAGRSCGLDDNDLLWLQH